MVRGIRLRRLENRAREGSEVEGKDMATREGGRRQRFVSEGEIGEGNVGAREGSGNGGPAKMRMRGGIEEE